MKKVRKCIICTAPTLADNKLCKRQECHIERQKRRIIAYTPTDEKKPGSGTYLSLRNCTHGISLESECEECDDEWNVAQSERYPAGDLPSNPRIKIK